METLEWLELIFIVTFLVVWGVLRLLKRGRVVDGRTVRSVGAFGDIEVTLVSSAGGRRYVALNYELQDDDKVRDIQVLLTSANAKRLAEMLEVAVAPGKTLLQARVAARRKALAKRQEADSPAEPAQGRSVEPTGPASREKSPQPTSR